ncbi:hypothetical protein NUV25_16360 [Burkholderia pseudomultivorans]|uniref:hypothetical protein n=1 Tax=Burkholderia pseudomultivorans TaxID=1207504 RepID=UPI0028768351|nr:hypothetical protein [Burkholderia pseudomultivorans]MDS0859281.1 hypothetical protein [Burkholderia pseudomultivorans]
MQSVGTLKYAPLMSIRLLGSLFVCRRKRAGARPLFRATQHDTETAQRVHCDALSQSDARLVRRSGDRARHTCDGARARPARSRVATLHGSKRRGAFAIVAPPRLTSVRAPLPFYSSAAVGAPFRSIGRVACRRSRR